VPSIGFWFLWSRGFRIGFRCGNDGGKKDWNVNGSMTLPNDSFTKTYEFRNFRNMLNSSPQILRVIEHPGLQILLPKYLPSGPGSGSRFAAFFFPDVEGLQLT
jgi:hypothetical protein